ncbi:translation initiation factor IF-2 [Candidatus Bandiella numerosa]|uniref:translation initiation factor IF-2 n=1 Tax=Candidatus Bandiella numerosa TaxID=2570586 RepID=UPI00249E8880|nr:translation initiation factor IF-2 [Candidatus Bandiella numerosa]WHA04342.1 translation initiation factor IF-2 [Candidatus Bandiella numerosa]
MTQDKPEQNSPIKKTLGLSTKKLSLKLPSKSIPSGNFINKKKGTVVVVTKTKSSKNFKGDVVGDLTSDERQNRLKAFLDAEKTKILDTNNNLSDVVKESENLTINDLEKNEPQNINNDNEIKNLDHIGRTKKENNVLPEINVEAPIIDKPRPKDTIDIKSKSNKLVDELDELEDKKSVKKKKIILDKKELKKISLTKIYDLEKEDDVIETKVTTIKVSSKNRNKDSRGKKQDKIYREVRIPEQISVQELANRMTEKASYVIKTLMNLGVMATINQVIDADTAELVVQELGHTPIRVSEYEIERSLLNQVDDSPDSLMPRAPIVTIMGHVDHGKTSLLDVLRQTDVVSGEHGGITQHIGAYNVSLGNNNSITFIDTPGHAAFTAMRMRGAKITDIVIIVVAADDGIKEQTIEAINHAKAADVPIIVAINKIDKAAANVEKVKNSLFNYELVPEDMGGDTIVVAVSAKEKKGLKELEDAILIQAEVLDLKANPNRRAEGVVIESKLDKSKGVLATLLVQKGTLYVGDIAIINDEYFKIRALVNDKGQKVDKAIPSTPIEVLGLSNAPEAGEKFIVVENDKIAKKIVELAEYKKGNVLSSTNSKASFDDLLKTQIDNSKTLNLIIKVDVHGSLEAIKNSLQKLANEEVKIKISHAIVGGITESDVSLAKVTNSIILGFNVRADGKTVKSAKTLGVIINYYSIIYNIIDDVKAMVGGLLSPIRRENTTGYAEIRQVIALSKVGKVAGCMVTEGVIRRKANARLIRNNIVIYDGKLGALKRFKDDVKEVKAGFECGISFEKFSDFKENDKLEIYEFVEEENKKYD